MSSLIGGVIRSADTHGPLPFAHACLTGTFTCADTDNSGVWNADWGYEGISVTASASGFHPKTVNVTSADIKYYEGLMMNGYWKVIELARIDPGDTTPSCFTGGTEVLMADGSTQPIQRIQVGDQVLAREGGVNTVVGVEQHLLGARQLYALDGGDPFVTAEHPFASDDGWRCIDPWALGAGGVTLAANPLTAGDRLQRAVGVDVLVAAGNAYTKPRLAARPVESVVASTADPETVVYDLLLDGSHTYIANGWVVHNKSKGIH